MNIRRVREIETPTVMPGDSINIEISLEVWSTEQEKWVFEDTALGSWECAIVSRDGLTRLTDLVVCTSSKEHIISVQMPPELTKDVQPGTHSIHIRRTDQGPYTYMRNPITFLPKVSDQVTARTGSIIELNLYGIEVDLETLPFSAPATSSKQVFAHWFPPYPRTIGNDAPNVDYWTLNWLASNPQYSWEKHHAAYGGFHRERPWTRQPLTGDYEYADLVNDCQLAKKAGIDGFFIDILTIWRTGEPDGDPKNQWLRILKLYDAAAEVGIKLVPMLDMTAHFASNPDDVVWTADQLTSKPAAYTLPDGRKVVSSFGASAQTAAWWATKLGQMAGSIAFIPCFQNWQLFAAEFAPISYAFTDWGERTPDGTLAYLTNDYAGLAHALNVNWCGPACGADTRPSQQVYTESEGSLALHNSWRALIEGGADMACVNTWNDYSECPIRPSTGSMAVWYLLTAYNTAWFKTGVKPTVTQDRIMYLHRTHPYNAPLPIGSWTAPAMQPIGTPKNIIEMCAFVKAPCRLEILLNGKVLTAVDATEQGLVRLTAVAQPGTPSFRLSRHGQAPMTVTSNWQITNTPRTFDGIYRGSDSTQYTV